MHGTRIEAVFENSLRFRSTIKVHRILFNFVPEICCSVPTIANNRQRDSGIEDRPQRRQVQWRRMELVSHVRRMSPIFPRVSTFSASLYFNRLLGKNGDGPFSLPKPSETRSSIFPRPIPPPPLSIHPKPLDIYRSAKVLLGFLRPN